ncbi:hypothetical protein A3B21_04165 [Candidatus Uhrbacteria bacterium RIFCSPLOWO2_01_FULL_47_24]|uniref:ComEC/Rec2-related protein domain-containing protein n=1 Tax=Candidatus Uhrbacteria bacterium RIFCSPLOWO2_01_FULL_47_24 TaxID=1802401 RepID=A0A1F7UTJ2_9BACT|nr:MAG: hypothetical protein A2753_02480 [Candidatus Uhrbacteria bacterium RIFCSPHIGHO2_01_FULL_47_11]OGL68780.1 MAG: hypothetical protein A3D58_01370 [Candidatus Uhrbacteria bacterium RIFCSPHIGHO2_02_FULL_46_47]OGL75242.1 MAG: hypothetical protein A3F52_05050 [Candidatus Uhrbacteria bacterium RIFCSPHIGHO2_12_FULL_47_11]OGL81585.1 MAG: hypothetical protein A3B21_04165 [Candidatus Uhrbacteria bacterium RIFCSPLOWO2_01_FULL_47_24]OGL83967.1 MAG: hypothetical protein A3J03_00930 [Candidatus Uhrbact
MRKSTLFFLLCLAFILGIAAHSIISPEKRIFESFVWYAGFLANGVVGAIVLCSRSSLGCASRRLKTGGYTIFFLALFFLGLFRYSQIISPSVIEVGQRKTFQGVVDALPRVREKTVAYVVRLSSHPTTSPGLRPPSPLGRGEGEGKILLTAEKFPQYQFGDELLFICVPEALSEYEQYAKRDGVSAACAFPEHVSTLTRPTASLSLRERGGVRATLYVVREKFESHLKQLFPNPYGGLLAGILYGDTSGISSALKVAFRETGIAHITALSGYNITIISIVLLSALIYVGLTRKQALPATILLILAFVLMTGAEASVVRAAIMGFLAMGAKGIGRLSKPRNAMALAGAVMLAVNPRLLKFDLGFLLSFLATIALIWFADDIAKRTLVRKLPKVWKIREAGAASCAAIIFTTPVILYMTGILGPFALLVNILVVPTVPAAMALGATAVALDMLWHPLGLGLSFIARAPLQYIAAVAEFFARFGAFHLQISFLAAFILFCGIVGGVYVWKQTGKTTRTV